MTATIIPFSTALTEREESDRVEQAEISAGWFFDDVTKAQRVEYLATTSSAADMHGHGSDAHCAAIDLAKRTWHDTTKEARALYERTVESFLQTGECSHELDDLWTEFGDRARLDAVAGAMASEAAE